MPLMTYMTKQLMQAIILTAIMQIVGCGNPEQDIKGAKEVVVRQTRGQVKTRNEKAIADLTQKYSSISGWDSLQPFTYVLQEMFIYENKPISFKGELIDITKSDTTYFLKVLYNGRSYNRDYIALISLTQEKCDLLKTLLKPTNYSTFLEGCFIFKVSKISSASPKITSDFEYDGEDSFSYLEYDFDETLLIFKGELIDFYINETFDQGNE